MLRPWPREGGPFFLGGFYNMLPHLVGVLDHVEAAFRAGGGVHQAIYDERFWDGLERFSRGWFDNNLLQEWIPDMPDVKAKLESGCTMADVGCGRGLALIRLAESFLNSRFVGFDAFEPTVEKATAKAQEAGVAETACTLRPVMSQRGCRSPMTWSRRSTSFTMPSIPWGC